MATVRAVYEGGVFRPTGPVDLPEGAAVEFEVRQVEGGSPAPRRPAKAAVYEILSRRYRTGEHDRAARHDEHQP